MARFQRGTIDYRIEGVDDGTANTDAVNIRQLAIRNANGTLSLAEGVTEDDIRRFLEIHSGSAYLSQLLDVNLPSDFSDTADADVLDIFQTRTTAAGNTVNWYWYTRDNHGLVTFQNTTADESTTLAGVDVGEHFQLTFTDPDGIIDDTTVEFVLTNNVRRDSTLTLWDFTIQGDTAGLQMFSQQTAVDMSIGRWTVTPEAAMNISAVHVGAPDNTNGDVLTWNETDGRWEAGLGAAITNSAGTPALATGITAAEVRTLIGAASATGGGGDPAIVDVGGVPVFADDIDRQELQELLHINSDEHHVSVPISGEVHIDLNTEVLAVDATAGTATLQGFHFLRRGTRLTNSATDTDAPEWTITETHTVTEPPTVVREVNDPVFTIALNDLADGTGPTTGEYTFREDRTTILDAMSQITDITAMWLPEVDADGVDQLNNYLNDLAIGSTILYTQGDISFIITITSAQFAGTSNAVGYDVTVTEVQGAGTGLATDLDSATGVDANMRVGPIVNNVDLVNTVVTLTQFTTGDAALPTVGDSMFYSTGGTIDFAIDTLEGDDEVFELDTPTRTVRITQDATKANTDLQNIDDDLTVAEQGVVRSRIGAINVVHEHVTTAFEGGLALGGDFNHGAFTNATTLTFSLANNEEVEYALRNFFIPFQTGLAAVGDGADDVSIITSVSREGQVITLTVEPGLTAPASDIDGDAGVTLWHVEDTAISVIAGDGAVFNPDSRTVTIADGRTLVDGVNEQYSLPTDITIAIAAGADWVTDDGTDTSMFTPYVFPRTARTWRFEFPTVTNRRRFMQRLPVGTSGFVVAPANTPDDEIEDEVIFQPSIIQSYNTNTGDRRNRTLDVTFENNLTLTENPNPADSAIDLYTITETREQLRILNRGDGIELSDPGEAGDVTISVRDTHTFVSKMNIFLGTPGPRIENSLIHEGTEFEDATVTLLFGFENVSDSSTTAQLFVMNLNEIAEVGLIVRVTDGTITATARVQSIESNHAVVDNITVEGEMPDGSAVTFPEGSTVERRGHFFDNLRRDQFTVGTEVWYFWPGVRLGATGLIETDDTNGALGMFSNSEDPVSGTATTFNLIG